MWEALQILKSINNGKINNVTEEFYIAKFFNSSIPLLNELHNLNNMLCYLSSPIDSFFTLTCIPILLHHNVVFSYVDVFSQHHPFVYAASHISIWLFSANYLQFTYLGNNSPFYFRFTKSALLNFFTCSKHFHNFASWWLGHKHYSVELCNFTRPHQIL